MPETARITYIGDFMAKQTYHYDAFISYRHTETDKFVAENLHRQLEAFRLPKTVLKGNKNLKRKIDRVFRDQEELPLTDDLEQTLVDALKDSEWLIVICSPRYKESIMCKKEIETFIKFHGKQHILTVLVEGDPKESFPEQLLYRMEEKVLPDGSVEEVRVPLEPLAADVRGNSHKEILTKMKTEKLRLLAAMFGLPFDELRQRHREQRLKRIMTASVIAAAAGLCFGVYFMITAFHIQSQKTQIEVQAQEIMEQSSEIAAQNEALAYNQALLLADLSEQYMSAGDRESAKETAVMALTEYEGAAMPVTAEGQMALLNSLRVYDIGQVYRAEYQIKVPGVIRSIEMSPDKDTLAICDSVGTLTIYDIKNREKLFELVNDSYKVGGGDNYGFLGGKYFVYSARKEDFTKVAFVYDIDNRKVIKEIDFGGTLLYCSADGEYLILTDDYNNYRVYDGETFEECGQIDRMSGFIQTTVWQDIGNGGVFMCTTDENGSRVIHFIDLKSCEEMSSYAIEEGTVTDVKYNAGVAYIAVRLQGEGYANYWDSKLLAIDTTTGEKLWEQTQTGFMARSIELPISEGATDLMLVTDATATLYNMQNGSMTITAPIPSEALDVKIFENENTFRLLCEDGQIVNLGTDYNEMIDTTGRFECRTIGNKNALYTEYGIVILAQEDDYLTVYTQECGPDVTEIEMQHELPVDIYFGGKDGMDEQGIAESLGLANPELVERVMYSDNGEQCFLFYANRDLVVVDVLTGQIINTIPDIPKLEWYAGKDEKQNTYIYGYEGCYVFDSKMQPIMYIESVRHIDLENRKIYLSWYSKEYEAPLYTNEELLQIAQEQ